MTRCSPTAPHSWPNWPSAASRRPEAGAAGQAGPRGSAARYAPVTGFGAYLSEAGDVGLLGPHRLGRLAERGEFLLGQVPFHDGADPRGADLGFDAQVDAGNAVLAVYPRADRQHRTGV